MKISDRGLALIKEFEGCELTAYVCPAGVLTVGYGSTGPHVKAGMTLTEEEAEALLRKDLERFEKCVNGATFNYGLTQGQFDACVSLAFNIGCVNFRNSTVLRKLASGDDDEAADAFRMWNKGGGKVLPGLVRRREAERELFLS